ncbi:hypothetical protein MYX84_00900 [Acidobacteria bacterium AH-259-O06]|nr:hypothetical protein [Acidobacteria bacterium AH-259-O06]
MTRKQVREVIVEQLKDTPDWANNRIAQNLGVDKKTVQTQRRRLESTGEIPKLTKFIGADGRKRKRPAALMAPNAEELQRILEQLRTGVDDIEGFCSAHGMPVFHDTGYDSLHGLTDEEKREWAVYILEGTWPEWEWVRQRSFRTPTEFYGPKGRRFMASIGCATKNPDILECWRKRLARYDGMSLQELEERLRKRNAREDKRLEKRGAA